MNNDGSWTVESYTPAYEVRDPSFSDMNLEQQVDAGCNHWCAEGFSGHLYYGETKQEAEQIRSQFQHR